MIANKLSKIKAYAFYLKRVMESNYVPLLENNLSYVSKIYNYLTELLSTNVQIDSGKAEAFSNNVIKSFTNIEYDLKRLGFIQAA